MVWPRGAPYFELGEYEEAIQDFDEAPTLVLAQGPGFAHAHKIARLALIFFVVNLISFGRLDNFFERWMGKLAHHFNHCRLVHFVADNGSCQGFLIDCAFQKLLLKSHKLPAVGATGKNRSPG